MNDKICLFLIKYIVIHLKYPILRDYSRICRKNIFCIYIVNNGKKAHIFYKNIVTYSL